MDPETSEEEPPPLNTLSQDTVSTIDDAVELAEEEGFDTASPEKYRPGFPLLFPDVIPPAYPRTWGHYEQ